MIVWLALIAVCDALSFAQFKDLEMIEMRPQNFSAGYVDTGIVFGIVVVLAHNILIERIIIWKQFLWDDVLIWSIKI